MSLSFIAALPVTLSRASSLPIASRVRPTRSACPLSPRCCAANPTSSNDDGGDDDDDDADLRQLRDDIATYLSARPDAEGPLSLAALERVGRTDLMSGIIRYGGYAEVSMKLGLDRSLFMPPTRVVSSNTFPSLNNVGAEPSASIRIGRDLEDVLSTTPPLSSSSSSPRTDTARRDGPRSDSFSVPSADQLTEYNASFRPRVTDRRVPPGETFALPTSSRLGFLLLVAVCTAANGATSPAVLDTGTIAILQKVAYALLVAHAALALYASSLLAPKLGRDPTLWAIKVLLGGPAGIRYMQSLGSL